MAGVALCAIDGLLVWRVLGLVTSTLRVCGFPKAGLPSCSAPFSRGSAFVLLSPPGGPFCPLSCPSPSKRTFLARLLFICLAVLLALSGCPFWPLSGPNPGPPQLSQSWFAWRCSLLFLVARLGKRAAEILQSGLSFVLCPPFSCDCASVLLSLSDTPFCPLSGPNPPKPTAPAATLGLLASAPCSVGGSVLASWRPNSFKTDFPTSSTDYNVHVPVHTQARQPHQTRAGGGSLSLSLPGGPKRTSPAWSAWYPLKRTSPAWSAWLCSLLSLWWSVLAAQQPILQNGLRQLGQLGCAPCSPSGVPFWPLSCPNPPKRTSPCWSAWLCSLLSLWWSVLAAQQPKSVKTDLPSSSTGWGWSGGWGGVGWDDNVHVPCCHPTPPHPPPHHPTPPTLKPDGVADEGKMVSQMRENQGGYGVTDEGDLVSQIRGLPGLA